MKQMVQRNKIGIGVLRVLSVLMLVALCLVGCKTSRQSTSGLSGKTGYLSSKVQLTVPHQRGAVLTVNGTMKLKDDERVQISFLMPILRTEVARIEITPDTLLLVDRMEKRYVRVAKRDLKEMLPRKADFAHLQKLIYAASKPGAKNYLTGKDVGLTSFEKGKIELSNFSNKEFTMTPTHLSSRYKEVELSELLEMLMSL